jgi:hypothetical protein
MRRRTVFGIMVSVAFELAAVSIPVHSRTANADAPDCLECHTCPEPLPDQPCLQPCPRHARAAVLSPDLGPDVVVLGELEDLYVPVRFDHRTHAVMAGMSKGCDICHHYTPPDLPHPDCKGCHPTDVVHEDLAQPGLKGAYHRRCLSCHSEWDHETACEVCHEKRKGGGLGGTATTVHDHSSYRPMILEELITFSTAFAPGDTVPFHHRNHSRRYERDCTECHREQSCTRCHIQDGGELHPMGRLDDVNLHDTCFVCHESQRCRDCHGRDPGDLFSHSDTGWPLGVYHADLDCRACHGRGAGIHKLDTRCETCHPEGFPQATFDHRDTGVPLDEVHREAECSDCHAGGWSALPRCDACHDDGRTYDRNRGFVASS